MSSKLRKLQNTLYPSPAQIRKRMAKIGITPEMLKAYQVTGDAVQANTVVAPDNMPVIEAEATTVEVMPAEVAPVAPTEPIVVAESVTVEAK